MTNANLEAKKAFIKENSLGHLVAELNTEHTPESLEAAIDWVYDSHTMTREDFRKKYFGF